MTQKFGDGISWEKFVVEVMEDTKNYVNKIFFKYDSETKEIIDHIENNLNKTKTNDIKVLDAGCNIGRWSKLLIERGFDYTGIDQSNLAILTAIYLQPNLSTKFQKKFLWDLEDNYKEEFDLVFCNNVLQHNTLEEKHRIIPKIYQSLKHNGILFINESTVNKQTNTQLTYDGWISLMNKYNFKFLESWNPNNIGLDECYLFEKS